MKITKVWFKDEKIFIRTDTGVELWQSLLWYPRLQAATDEQRAAYKIDKFGDALRWDEIDEDISLESFTYEEREPVNPIAQAFKAMPFINVSQFARMINIPQSLMASYIAGRKKPSKMQRAKIEAALHECGKIMQTAAL